MYVWSDITAVQDYEMHYMNASLKRCVFNLDLNRESVSELEHMSGVSLSYNIPLCVCALHSLAHVKTLR